MNTTATMMYKNPQANWIGSSSLPIKKKVSVSTMKANTSSYQPVPSSYASTVVVYYHCEPLSTTKTNRRKMRGARRVITFCLLTAVLPVFLLVLPLYLRNVKFADIPLTLMEADVMPITDGVSSFFCQKHTVTAELGRFSAHQLQGEPVVSTDRRTAVLERVMSIPDDTLEYWGFHLLPQSTVTLAVCASSPGARLLVVRGERNLKLCGLLQHSSVSETPSPPPMVTGGDERIHITFQEQQEKEEKPKEPLDEENHGGEEPEEEALTALKLINTTTHPVRHIRSKMRHQREVARALQPSVQDKNLKSFGHLSDVAHFEGAIEHGGNAGNYTVDGEDGASSLSSFESELLSCFSGKTLFQRSFAEGGKTCETGSLGWTGSLRLSQTVKAQGHFYYVFYSDNDLKVNEIRARFILNATRYNFTNARQSCTNVTECSFNLGFWGGEGTVYLEGASDVAMVSTCEPRLAVYLLFPVCAMFIVLACGLL